LDGVEHLQRDRHYDDHIRPERAVGDRPIRHSYASPPSMKYCVSCSGFRGT
jgi:hypothetical protein